MKSLTLLLATLAATLSVIMPASAGDFGAIAFSARTGSTAWAHSFPSKQGALNFVDRRCRQQANDCRSFWFRNACGAVAIGSSGGWGTAWAGSSTQAQVAAVNNCAAHDDGCRVVRWQCSGAN